MIQFARVFTPTLPRQSEIFGSPWVFVGGVTDHVHILFDMGKLVAPVKFVEQIKRESSKFIKTIGPRYSTFYWQRGYGMFSVSPQRQSLSGTLCRQPGRTSP